MSVFQTNASAYQKMGNLLFALSVCHFCRFRFISVLASLSLCKVRKPSNHAKYRYYYFWKIMAAAFRDLYQIGYSTIILPEIPWRRPLNKPFLTPQKKRTQPK